MRSVTHLCSLVLLFLASACFATEPVTAPDLRQAVPAEAYLAIHGRHNPERDDQAEYLKEVWQTVEDEKLLERALEIVTSRMEQEDFESAQSVVDELRAAVEPIDWQAVANCQEIVYAQTMVAPTTQHLALIRLTPDAAALCESALGNLFAIAEKYSEGNVPVVIDKEGDIQLTTLGLPKDVPFQPVFARVGDVLLFSSSKSLARQSLSMLLKGGIDSKFNDPRLAHALTKLPEPEDTSSSSTAGSCSSSCAASVRSSAK